MTIREQLRREIEETRANYHELLHHLSDAALARPSDNPAWTIREVLYHMSLAPRFLPADVSLILARPWFYPLIRRLVPAGLFHWFNVWWTRFAARSLSRASLGREYDRSHRAALRALDRLAEDDFGRRLTYPEWDPLLAGDVTVERLFHYLKDHFDSHAAQIREAGREESE